MLAIYTRLSKEDEKSNSISHQKSEGKDLAKSIGLDYTIYDEGKGISGGADIEDRPQLQKLIEDIQSGIITAVWFRNENRLSRNSLTYARFVAVVKVKKTVVYFGSKKVDYSKPDQALTSGILAQLAEYQRTLQGLQASESIHRNLTAGKSHGPAPYGFMSNEYKMLVINEEEAHVVKRMFDLSLQGIGQFKIANMLNDLGIPTRYQSYEGTYRTRHGRVKDKANAKWAGATIRGIIVNPLYKGERIVNGETFTLPAIIDPHYWQKVNDNLQNNRNNSGKAVETPLSSQRIAEVWQVWAGTITERLGNLRRTTSICVQASAEVKKTVATSP